MTHSQQPKRSSQDPLAEKIIERIEQEGVVPKPRWQFTLRERLLWGLLALSLVIAAAATGAMIFALSNAGWEFRAVTHENFFSYLFDVLPIFWIAVIIVLLLLAYQNIKRTKSGYRYPVFLVVGFAVIGIVLGGLALFASGLGQEVEEELGARIPLYRSVVESQRRLWQHPERGLLAGEIIREEGGYATFTVRTFNGVFWTVNGDDLRSRDREFLAPHRTIRLIGAPSLDEDAGTFHACFVFPWEIRGPQSLGQPLLRQPQALDAGTVRNADGERSTICKGVRPYEILKSMRR
jgi:uncharacterized membrane protein